MQLLRWIIGVCLLVIAPLVAQAQPSAWRVVVYEYDRGDNLDKGGALDVMSASGVIERHVLPPSILPSSPYGVPQIAVSPNLRYAAVAYGTDDPAKPASLVAIVDLFQDRCCVMITPPLANPQSYLLAGFSPDSSQLAFAYVAFPDLSNRMLKGGLVVADVASGSITATLDLAQMGASTNVANVSFIQTGAWAADGIRFVPSCWMCDGTLENDWYRWNPATGAVGRVDNAYYSVFADVLPLTGEMLYTVDNVAYPSGSQPGYIPPANVVEYYAGGVPDDSDAGLQTSAPNATVVYHDPNNLNLPLARWVADGRAFVLQGNSADPTGTLVFRDQTQIGAGFGESDRFIAATPEGWLAQDAAKNINHYVVGAGTLDIVPLAQIDSRVALVWNSPVGQAGLPPFAPQSGQ